MDWKMAMFARGIFKTLAAAVLLGVVVAAAPVMAADGGSRAFNLEKGNRLDEVRTFLSRRLGVPLEKLKAETDLVRNLQLDLTEVVYAVLELCDAYGKAEPEKTPTKVADIVAYLEDGPVAAAPEAPAATMKEAYTEGQEDLKTRGFVEGEDGNYLQTIFFATNREPAGADVFFSGARAHDRALHYGKAEVNIPRSHKRGQLETPWMQIKALNDPRKHIYIADLSKLGEREFFDALGSDAAEDDILVYIHGFNVPFEEAVRRGAQIAFDFGFPGEVVAFSWPSDGSLVGYNADREDAYWSVKYAEEFFRKLHARVGNKRVHVVAHSMGSQVLLQSLRLIAYRNAAEPMFETVILAAPDFDAGLFSEQIAAEIRPLAANWVIYTSEKDGALNISSTINAVERLGTPLTVIDGYQIIDATKIEVTPWNVPEFHSYYATKQKVIADMIAVLKGKTPEERALQPHLTAAGTFWSIGD
ncbi:MAG: alpha/beta fold hydrolase [Hyphomicrobiales bacterium]